jgi:methylated-DNA-[protein]-cysteine S-methyltransferase
MENALLVDSPVGPIRIVESGGSIVEVSFAPVSATPGTGSAPAGASPILENAARELADYFAGSLTRFTVPVLPDGTGFERLVWTELLSIPWGATRTYGEIAAAIGKPKASRAVGRAIGANPVAIIIPCHRVIGKDGSLTGYAGGLDRKKKLLAVEGFHG